MEGVILFPYRSPDVIINNNDYSLEKIFILMIAITITQGNNNDYC